MYAETLKKVIIEGGNWWNKRKKLTGHNAKCIRGAGGDPADGGDSE